MANPFLVRTAEGGGIGHGKKSERRVAKHMGARLTPNSGAMTGAKSDAVLKESDFRLEMKSTTKQTLALERGWLAKISQEALVHHQKPAVVISFVDAEGKPAMRRHSEWILMPLEVFKELTS